MIAGGKAGCVLCGAIHVCDRDCKDIIQTDEFDVCAVTSVCIRPRQIAAENTFHDTVLFGQSESMKTNDNDNGLYDKVEGFITELIMSEKAMTVLKKQQERTSQRLADHAVYQIQNKQQNIFDAILCSWQNLSSKNNIESEMGIEIRQHIANECCAKVYSILNNFTNLFRLNVKTHELRNTVFGIVYLLRDGIKFNSVQILPRVNNLEAILPTENMLDKHFNFKSRYITDLENKCKFVFRTQNSNEIDLTVFVADK